jgi:HD-GYP domain-containing protein (c-di-GMP phosphodiesterase class II)
VYGALTEDRPYRGGLNLETVAGIMKQDIPAKLDRTCFDGLMDAVTGTEIVVPSFADVQVCA